MSQFFSRDNGKYKELSFYEDHMVAMYYADYNKAPFVELIRSNADMSQGMRDFIADMLDGSIKRPRGKKASTLRRDMLMWQTVQDLLQKGYSLTSNAKRDGAGVIVGQDFDGIEEEAVIKAVQRIDKKIAAEYGITFYSAEGDILSCIGAFDERDFF